jgi:hypothetical protein
MRKLISGLLLSIPLVSFADTWNVVNFGGVSSSSTSTQEYGNCDQQTTMNGTCTWGDGQVMRYAGTIDSRRLFAANTDEITTWEWGAYNAASYLDITGITNYTALTTVITGDLNGRANQLAYMNACGNGVMCNTYGGNIGAFERCGLKGMYLPSAGELNLIWTNIGTAGGMSNSPGAYYWSSSEYSNTSAWIFNGVGSGSENGRNSTFLVRCARSFSL